MSGRNDIVSKLNLDIYTLQISLNPINSVVHLCQKFILQFPNKKLFKNKYFFKAKYN